MQEQANELSAINKLAEAIIEKLQPRISTEIALWDVSTIAEYLKCSESHTMQRVICQPTFPKSIRIPTANGKSAQSRSQPRWRAKEVIEWTLSHQDGQAKTGRPRKH
ncbi:AlpA family transcriptional regulator [Hahella sp. HN01]|uniref:helix-turn-helix transcriptional regulator n=1 Tax=Hahella sp. HN01 TaxID=2847262 RepID=UPI001C1ED6F2|nr:hypothetical protein [Hahella sp. HN01]MBU6950926.1 hypothetical protein [Hahella sp. HN01]